MVLVYKVVVETGPIGGCVQEVLVCEEWSQPSLEVVLVGSVLVEL